MLSSLTVLYLHNPDIHDEKRLPVCESGLNDAFADFCRETFNSNEPLDYPLLKLVTVNDTEALVRSLFGDDEERRSMTEDGRSLSLILIDDELIDSHVGETTLRDWLRVYFPAIPRVLVTYHGHSEVPLPQRRWTKKPIEVFVHPERNHERIVHLFKSFWMPRFWTSLKQYVRVKAGTNWHTPGHNGGHAFASSPFLKGFHEAFGSTIFRTDLSVSVESLGDLSAPEEGHTPLSEAQKMTSEIFGTAQSCYVTNGTSTSNKAMLQTLLRPGELVLVDRNCHKSVHHAIAMSGAVPHYLPANYNARYGVWGPVALEDIRRELEEQQPRLLILTTCTYEGVLYPVWKIGQLCQKVGALFYADEAWAAYLAFHPAYTLRSDNGSALRYNAVNISGGAHFAVQSTHKVLSAFSQASMIHVSSRFKHLLEDDASPQYRWLRKRFSLHGRGSYEKFSHDFHEILRYWHSTSPHYPFMATLDIAGVQMRLEGMRLIDERIQWTKEFRRKVAQLCGKKEEDCFAGLQALASDSHDWEKDGYMKDPLKLVLSLKNAAACRGFKDALRKAHIQWEKSTATTILFLVTMGTQEEHFSYLLRVCRQCKSLIGRPENAGNTAAVANAVSGQAVVSPHEAALCDGELVTLDDSIGRIASQFLVPYPPGIPVFLPGLRVSKQMVSLIKSVIESEGPAAVHGLFYRASHGPYFVEVLNTDEETRLLHK